MRFLFALAPALLLATGVADAAGKDAPPEDLIAALGHPDPAERGAAEDRLLARGEEALPALRKALHHRDAEVRRRVQRLITLIDGEPPYPRPQPQRDPDTVLQVGGNGMVLVIRPQIVQGVPNKINQARVRLEIVQQLRLVGARGAAFAVLAGNVRGVHKDENGARTKYALRSVGGGQFALTGTRTPAGAGPQANRRLKARGTEAQLKTQYPFLKDVKFPAQPAPQQFRIVMRQAGGKAAIKWVLVGANDPAATVRAPAVGVWLRSPSTPVGILGGHGWVVDKLEPGSFGERIGLREGDLLRRLNGKPLRNAADLDELLLLAETEDVMLVLQRDGAPVRIDVGAVLRDRQKQGN